MDLKEIGINTWNLFDSSQDMDYWKALANAALNLRLPYLYLVAQKYIRVIKYKRLRWTGNVARMEEGKPTGKRPLGRSRSWLEGQY